MIELIISFIFSAIITAIAYLIVPTIFCVIGYKTKRVYSLKTIKKIAIINGICVFIIFLIIRISAGETGVSGAVFLWSYVAYWIMKKFLLEKSVDHENVNRKERSFKLPFIVAAILLIFSFALNLYQFGIRDDTEYNPIQSNNESTQDREKLEFLDEYIVMVEDDNTDLYHKYECYRFKAENFWAYNIDQADSLGYEPCPNCCK